MQYYALLIFGLERYIPKYAWCKRSICFINDNCRKQVGHYIRKERKRGEKHGGNRYLLSSLFVQA